MAEHIEKRRSLDMYIEDMVKYCIIVDRRRAFPEIRDGLKPVHRRALFAMLDIGAVNRTLKCARIVGETIGKYSPHGDTSVYDALIVLGQWWKTKMPLVYVHGNYGTVMGDGAAAMRYTEARISDFCFDAIIGDMKETKNAVDWKENFDRSCKEPEFFPVKMPILLVNGTFGIGVGISTNLPSHNLVEVINATRALIKNPKADVVLIPDHCQPLEIFNTNWKEISDTGFGSYKVRGIVEVVEEKGYPVIYIKSLPDMTTTEQVIAKLNDMVLKKQLPMVHDAIDLSKDTVCIKVVLKKGSDPGYVIETLYNKCGVQASVRVNFQAVDYIDPKRFSYKEYLLNFLDFRMTTKFRMYCNLYKNTATRTHKLETFIKVIESGVIDKIITDIKKQNTTDIKDAEELLIKKYGMTDIQANYILCTEFRKLTKGYLKQYKEEYAKLVPNKEFYKKAITDNGDIILKEIDQELADIAKKYGTPRLCKVIDPINESNIPKGTFKVVVTEKNYIRKIPDTDRVTIVRGDQPKFIVRADNAENVLLFDNKGKVFKFPVHKIPISDKTSAGTDIRILNKNLTADVIYMCYENTLKHIYEGTRKHFVVVSTRNNVIKKLELEDFLNVNLSGLRYTTLKDNDEVVGIDICPDDLDVVIYTKMKALRLPMTQVPLFKRSAAGSKAMMTDDEIEGQSVIYPDTECIVVMTNNGKANKFPISGLPRSSRGRAGNSVIKLDPGDSIHNIYGTREVDTLRVLTSEGVTELPISEIKLKSGIAAGQKVISQKPVIKCELVYQT